MQVSNLFTELDRIKRLRDTFVNKALFDEWYEAEYKKVMAVYERMSRIEHERNIAELNKINRILSYLEHQLAQSAF